MSQNGSVADRTALLLKQFENQTCTHEDALRKNKYSCLLFTFRRPGYNMTENHKGSSDGAKCSLFTNFEDVQVMIDLF